MSAANSYIEFEHIFVRQHGRLEQADVDDTDRVLPRWMRRQFARRWTNQRRIPIVVSVETINNLAAALETERARRVLVRRGRWPV